MKLGTLLLLCACLMPADRAFALKLQPFAYHESFESGNPQVVLWAKNGEATVHFNGPTDELAFEGKRSLKLDVTLDSGSYHYWGMVVHVPCEGRLKLSARIFVAPGTTATVGFGPNLVFPPTGHSGCSPAKSFSKPTGSWRLVEQDLVQRARVTAEQVLKKNTINVTAADSGAMLDRWSLFIYGRRGDRAIVYVDDVRIEGEVPSDADYQAEIQRRWAAARERFQQQVDQWRRQFTQYKGNIEHLPEMPPSARRLAEKVRSSADTAETLLNTLANRGYASPAEVDALQEAFWTMRYGPQTLDTIAANLKKGRPYIVFALRRAINNQQPPPDELSLAMPVAEELTCAACRDEYESISAVVYAVKDIKGLSVTASDLRSDRGIIPARAVDIYVLKWWYQGDGGTIGYRPDKVYIPELLLKDDRLVRVDRENKQNYLRSTAEDGTQTYLLCSGPTSDNLKDVRPVDADTLQPVDIPANTIKQFWITVHVPANAAAGTYTGRLTFKTADSSLSVPLRVTVHPFDLLPSRLIYSIYYRARLSKDGKPTIGSEYKSTEQYWAEMEDMKAHGVLYPSNYQGWDEQLLPRVLQIRQAVGLPGGPFYNLGMNTGNATDPGQLAALKEKVKKWIKLCRSFGYKDVYFYGIDEATGERLRSQQAAWQAVQEAGGKTFVACYKGTFEAMGGLLNCAVLAHWPDPAEAAKWHSVGSQAFCYANPQVGVEEPETYRRNFGLVLWKAGFDGAMDYAYQHAFGHIWNDYDHPHYRDHNFTYPTINGVVDTIQWEGFREGVDDVRYVTTLEQAIEQAPASIGAGWTTSNRAPLTCTRSAGKLWSGF